MLLSLDTSCYTTSVALISINGEILADKRRVLDVPFGKRGLAQSEALFQHIRNLPILIEEIALEFQFSQLMAIGVSTRPRGVADSYMPVFLGGENAARNISAALNIPLIATTHQEGHMSAGIATTDFNSKNINKFLMCHFSGGTSEIYSVIKTDEGRYQMELISATNDIHAGQFIDRIGVEMGLCFPAGKELEKLAQNATGEIPKIRTYFNNGAFGFSGQETAISMLLKEGTPHELVARIVEETLARTIKKALDYSMEKTEAITVLMVGGVMSNQYIKEYLIRKLYQSDLYFAPPKYATDNAVGVGMLALERYKSSSCK